MTTTLERQVEHYQGWRDELIGAISAYQSWLDESGHVDALQSLQLYDLLESVKRDRLMLAFVAEFSRGKTELINALFFSDFKQRLLPSDVGRTTMCPTEIFYDPLEAPYIRLLPIETRYRDESIAQLKHKPVEWVTIKLNVDAHDEMIHTMRALTEVKTVAKVEARTMGLWDDQDPAMLEMARGDDRVEIPAWRHAMINYPHPLLKSGLVILDTPGLNALGSEPELTLSMIPNAHAVLFLLAMDTGVTKSDLEIWRKYIQEFVAHRIAVLNKIDVLWDELKSWDEIQESVRRQVQNTASLLDLPLDNVLAVSAQKALLARIRHDDELLEKSGIQQLENLLANKIIPLKREILRQAVTREIGMLVQTSHRGVHNQLAATRHEFNELSALTGKNREVVKAMLNKAHGDKILYEETVASFNIARGVIVQQGRILMTHLSLNRLDEIFDKSRESIQDSWTTAGLTRGMQSLIRQTAQQFQRINKHSGQIKGLVDAAYLRFHEKHGFERLSAPELDLGKHKQAFLELARKTDEFCHDPVNVMTEKHFLVKKFFAVVVAEARSLFEQARTESENWLRGVLAPLMTQIHDYKEQIERRLENIHKIHDNLDTLRERLSELEALQVTLYRQAEVLDQIVLKLQITAQDSENRKL